MRVPLNERDYGDHVGLIGIDWSAAADASAYDLSVSDEHNYFITASDEGAAVLIHNMTEGAFCGVPLDADLADDLASIQDALIFSGDSTAVGDVLGTLKQADLESFAGVLARAGDDSGVVLARNSQFSRDATEGIAKRAGELEALQPGLGDSFVRDVLGDGRYEEFWTGAAGFNSMEQGEATRSSTALKLTSKTSLVHHRMVC